MCIRSWFEQGNIIHNEQQVIMRDLSNKLKGFIVIIIINNNNK